MRDICCYISSTCFIFNSLHTMIADSTVEWRRVIGASTKNQTYLINLKVTFRWQFLHISGTFHKQIELKCFFFFATVKLKEINEFFGSRNTSGIQRRKENIQRKQTEKMLIHFVWFPIMQNVTDTYPNIESCHRNSVLHHLHYLQCIASFSSRLQFRSFSLCVSILLRVPYTKRIRYFQS